MQPAEELPPEERAARTALVLLLDGYRSNIEGIHEQLRTRNDLRKVAASDIIEGFITTLTTILGVVEDRQDVRACFPQGPNAFRDDIENALFQLYAAGKAVEITEEKFDAEVDVQSYNVLRRCRGFLELALEEIRPVVESLQQSQPGGGSAQQQGA
jgi:hypothetical protein